MYRGMKVDKESVAKREDMRELRKSYGINQGFHNKRYLTAEQMVNDMSEYTETVEELRRCYIG